MDLNFLQVVRRAEEASYFCLFRSRDFRICPKEARAFSMRRSIEGHQRVRDNCVPWIQHCRGFNNESAIGRSVTVQQLIANGRMQSV